MRDVRMSRKVRAQSVRFLTLWALRCEQDVCMWGGREIASRKEDDFSFCPPKTGMSGYNYGDDPQTGKMVSRGA